MCGIAGCLGQVPEDYVSKVSRLLSPRGPDSSGSYFNRLSDSIDLSLVHTRLSILDPSSLGNQPIHNSDKNLTLVYNGEIYNFKELRHQLIDIGYTFKSNCDTEVLLLLWEEYGPECLSMLNGMFAFAVFDKRHQSLYLCRDHAGIKPLFYSSDPYTLFFGSEIKSILPFLDDTPSINPVSLAQHLTYIWAPGPSTIHSQILSLEPGSYVVFNFNHSLSSQIVRWYPLPKPTSAPLARSRTRDLCSDARTHLRQAVCRQTISDVPLGSFLSGGLDSSIIAYFLSENNINTTFFTLGPSSSDPGFADDLPFARLVADHLNLDLVEVPVTSSDLHTSLEWLISRLDVPLADPAALHVYSICKAASSRGIKVLLSGAGGDDLFTGYRRHLSSSLANYLSVIPHSLTRRLLRLSSYLPSHNSISRRLSSLLASSLLPTHQRLLFYFQWFEPSIAHDLLHPKLSYQISTSDISAPFYSWISSLDSTLTDLQKLLALEQRYFLADHNLFYTDIMSMSASVEVRVPFLDPDLLEFSWSLPDHIKQRNFQSKWILRQCMRDLLPKSVIYRPKTGFGSPLRNWINTDLKPLVLQTLSKSNLDKQEIFESSAVAQILDHHYSGTRDYAYLIFSLMTTCIWYDTNS